MTQASAQNFQPQVGDTTNGPTEHTYIPRSDGTILINGIVYVPQPATTPIPAVAAVPIPVPAPMPAQFPITQPMQPLYPGYPYPMQPQPIFGGGPPPAGIPFAPGAGFIPQPAIGTLGATASEIQMQQMQNSDVFKKQDMKPADDDPFRMYWVREHDNTWSQRNRMTIDSGDIGECRQLWWTNFDSRERYD
ncbi:hypothetical protein ACMFMF_008522 [Clarireedia jacksonii]